MFETYARERAACDAHNEWVRANTKGSYHPGDVPAHLQHVDNDMRSRVELFEWYAKPPHQYFAYVKEGTQRGGNGWHDGGTPDTLTNWMGEPLGRITRGRTWRDNLGGKRVAIWVDGTNGRQYWGTYYTSAGTYARITETIDSARKHASTPRGKHG